jgi:hypothetical protein
LTHVTIVASVDTEEVPGAKTGVIQDGTRQINRPYADFRITPETEQYINGNNDGFERKALLKSYRSFVAGRNHVEHDQRLEMTKGRILDAVARDLGDTVYVDILVATNREHKELIADITSGRLTTLSMGCEISFSICTECGNVGADEPALCEHVRYGKGGRFLDHRGRNAKVAELCGHHSAPNGGIQFIEASWVAIPAFKGAVLRNILEPAQLPSQISRKAQKILAETPLEWVADPSKLQKAAKLAADDFFGADDTGGDTGEAPAEEKPTDKDPVDKLIDDTEKYVLDKADQKIREKLKGKTETRPENALAHDTNESLVHTARYDGLVNSLIMARYPVVEWIDHLANLEAREGLRVPAALYRAALLATPSGTKYLQHCADLLGRDLTSEDQTHLVRIGRILNAHQEVQQVRTVVSNMRRSRERS